MTAKLPSDAIGIEVDGESVSPETVDSVATMKLALAFLELVQAIAEDRGETLTLRGLEVRDKCAAIFAHTESAAMGRQCMAQAIQYVTASGRPPHGLQVRVEDVRRAKDELPESHRAVAFVGNTRRVFRAGERGYGLPLSTLSVRARPIRIGGRTPTVTLESAAEQRPFTLQVRRETARELAVHLYSEVDIEAKVFRDDDGLIESGTLEEFHPVTDDDPFNAWAQYFSAAMKP